MSDSQITNGQRAAHALDGINAHARSSAGLEHGIREEYFFFDDEREAEPGADQARLANLLRDLRHYADRRGLSFDGALSTARRDYERQRTAYQPGDAIRLAGNSRDAAAAEGFPPVGEILKARPGRVPEYQVEFIIERQWIAEPDLEAAPRFPAVATRLGEISSACVARRCFIQTAWQVEEACSHGRHPEAEDVRDLAELLSALSRWSGIPRPALLWSFSEVIDEKDGQLVARIPDRKPVTLAALDAPGTLSTILRTDIRLSCRPAAVTPPASRRTRNRSR